MVQWISPRMSLLVVITALLWSAPFTDSGRHAWAQGSAQSLGEKLDLSLYGYVETSYTQNFNTPSDGVNQNRIFDGDANSFRPNMAQLVLERAARASGDMKDRAGFRVKLNAGEDAKFTGGNTGSDEFDFQETYVQYIAPIGNGLTLQAGRMNTLIGYEVIESPYNPNFSRSFLFGMGEPFTVTGLRLSYDFSDDVSLAVSGINSFTGAQVDNNNGKSVEALLSLAPMENVGVSLFGFWGPEGDRNGKSDRVMVGGIFDMQITEKATVVLEGYYGNQANNYTTRTLRSVRGRLDMDTTVTFEEDVAGNDISCTSGVPCRNILVEAIGIVTEQVTENHRWNGLAGYFMYDFNDRWGFRLRGEVFEDAAGQFSCGGNPGSAGNALVCADGAGQPQTLWETTWTLQYTPLPNLLTRAEFRYDKSNRNTFMDGAGIGNNQTTLAFNAIYLF